MTLIIIIIIIIISIIIIIIIIIIMIIIIIQSLRAFRQAGDGNTAQRVGRSEFDAASWM